MWFTEEDKTEEDLKTSFKLRSFVDIFILKGQYIVNDCKPEHFYFDFEKDYLQCIDLGAKSEQNAEKLQKNVISIIDNFYSFLSSLENIQAYIRTNLKR